VDTEEEPSNQQRIDPEYLHIGQPGPPRDLQPTSPDHPHSSSPSHTSSLHHPPDYLFPIFNFIIYCLIFILYSIRSINLNPDDTLPLRFLFLDLALDHLGLHLGYVASMGIFEDNDGNQRPLHIS
jgi:hypothetical protein